MMNFALEAPWYTYQKKVKALFERDEDINVGEIYVPDNADANFMFDIEVCNHDKFVALDRVMPKIRRFGNVVLGVCLYDEENSDAVDTGIELYKTVFEGNPIVKDIKDSVDQTGTRHGYVRFQPEVIQFFDDNLADYSRNWSGLAQDIANEVFGSDFHGVHFCTADKKEGAE